MTVGLCLCFFMVIAKRGLLNMIYIVFFQVTKSFKFLFADLSFMGLTETRPPLSSAHTITSNGYSIHHHEV